jgi:hypothetical protein
LRGIFGSLKRRDILTYVQTLVLDGLSVTAELCSEILIDPSFNVRILSLRDAKNLNERKLRSSLQYACRSTRPAGSPKLKGLYIFGNKDSLQRQAQGNTIRSHGAQIGSGWNHGSLQALNDSLHSDGEAWYGKKGKTITKPIADEWAGTLLDCHDIIAFDAVLCTGPRHPNSPAYGKSMAILPDQAACWAVATIALGGCAGCHSAPEGLTMVKTTPPSQLPLLSPPPLFASSVAAATYPQIPEDDNPSFIARCLPCLRERYCSGCHQWWCEECYRVPGASAGAGAGMTDPIIVVDDELAGFQLQGQDTPKAKVRNGHCIGHCLID